MTDLRNQIRDALRDRDQETLSVTDVDAMRRVVVASVRGEHDKRRAGAWLQPLAVAATMVAMVAAGAAVGQRFDRQTTTGGGAEETRDSGAQAGARARQLQFATPGGTRIIWIFNSDLNLKTTP